MPYLSADKYLRVYWFGLSLKDLLEYYVISLVHHLWLNKHINRGNNFFFESTETKELKLGLNLRYKT